MKRINQVKQRRWIVLIAFCLINLCTGSVYSWSVFAGPMADRLSLLTGQALHASDLSIVFTVYSGMALLMMVVAGALNARFSSKIVLFIAGLFYGGGFLVSSMATNIGMLILGYGVMCNIGGSIAYNCTICNSVRLFPDRKGFAGGITTATYGLSAVIVSPIANHFNTVYGVCTSFRILGVVFLILICIAALLTERPPEQIPGIVADDDPAVSVTPDRTWRQMLADRKFYVMYLILFSSGFFGYMVTSQAATMAGHVGMSTTKAAAVVSLLSLANAVGRVGSGTLSDLIGRINTLTVMILLAVTGLILLIVSDTGLLALFCIGIALVGLAYGSFTAVYPGFCADQFGPSNNTVNYGILFTSFNLAGMLSPILSGSIYGATGTYVPAYYAAICISCISFSLTIVFRLMNRPAK